MAESEQLIESLEQFLSCNTLPNIWWIGYSGGMDSTVLLYALKQISRHYPSVQLRAIHVNHGIAEQADEWEEHCRDFCHWLNVKFHSEKVTLSNQTRQGLEQLARKERWRVFQNKISKNDVLWLAHHKDDQVETIFLNLLRGSGVAGVRGMQADSQRYDIQVLRPFLNSCRSQLAEFANTHQLNWIDDPSNFESDQRRNFLRNDILPVIEKQWSGYRDPVVRFGKHMESTQRLLDEFAESDFRQVYKEEQDGLSIADLKVLSWDRLINLLRYWIVQFELMAPSSSKLEEFVRQLQESTIDSQITLATGEYCLKQSGQCLYMIPEALTQPVDYEYHWANFPETIVLPKINRQLTASTNSKRGIRAPDKSVRVTVRSRKGGERCWPHTRSKATTLKKFFNESGVPGWERDKIPLVFYDEQLVAAVGYFYDYSFFAEPGSAIEFKLEEKS
ncbi:tRNA lysidine(34) synthetase TilS [Pleionea sediminis]|uniref:tRNA lysidine(34) synthetase TilS n=1 Tax=Pleionea sediminis TaxID=2569479 RepID=UPI001186DCE1|nr:tRNA lysidine(34) synthetase TilS [Pleionea sediminis]